MIVFGGGCLNVRNEVRVGRLQPTHPGYPSAEGRLGLSLLPP